MSEQVPIRTTPGKISVTTVDTVETVELHAAGEIDPGMQIQSRRYGPSNAFPGFHAAILPEMATYTCHIEAVRPAKRRSRNNSAMEANTAAWAYCRCAMLFFLALLITWVCVSFLQAGLLMRFDCEKTDWVRSRQVSTVSMT
jgi:hypothetical protein